MCVYVVCECITTCWRCICQVSVAVSVCVCVLNYIEKPRVVPFTYIERQANKLPKRWPFVEPPELIGIV